MALGNVFRQRPAAYAANLPCCGRLLDTLGLDGVARLLPGLEASLQSNSAKASVSQHQRCTGAGFFVESSAVRDDPWPTWAILRAGPRVLLQRHGSHLRSPRASAGRHSRRPRPGRWPSRSGAGLGPVRVEFEDRDWSSSSALPRWTTSSLHDCYSMYWIFDAWVGYTKRVSFNTSTGRRARIARAKTFVSSSASGPMRCAPRMMSLPFSTSTL